jgi:type II secretory pathway component GspD/PulD (secretin)
LLAGLAGLVLSGFGAVLADPVPGGGAAQRKSKSVRSAPVAAPVPAELRMYRALQKRVTVKYKDVPLNEVVKDLTARGGATIVADPRGLKDTGVLPNTPITAGGTNVRLSTLLDQIVTPLNLDFVVAGDSVRITDRQRATGDLVTVTYPINDLVLRIENGRNVVDAEAVKDLINSITVAIAPDSWDEPDGPGSVSFTDKTNSLVIRQSPDVQREIQTLLARLRQERRFPTVRRPTFPARGASLTPGIEAPPDNSEP